MSKSFTYPGIVHGPEGLVVERLGITESDALFDLVPAIVDLTRRTYGPQLEAPNGPLEPGTIGREYTVASKSEPHKSRIRQVLGAAGAYYVVRSPHDSGKLDGMVNVKPLSKADPWYDYETWHLYIPGILADPPRAGIGSAALHAALSDQVRYEWETVHLDGFTGSSVNTWYQDGLGFEDEGPSEGWEIGGTELPTTRYTGNPVYRILRRLEAAHPALLNTVVEL